MSVRVLGQPHVFPLKGDLRPQNTVLVVIDMQHDFCSEGGYMHRLGADLKGLRAPIDRIRRVLAAARAANFRVLHTREGYRSDLSDLQPWKRGGGPNDSIAIGDPGPLGRALIRGERCWDIIPELAPAPGEHVFDKASYGPFATTDIDVVLRNWGIRHLVLMGVTSDCCVTSCLREALDRGYDCMVLADCVGSANAVHHEAALTLMRKESGVFGTTAISDAFIDAIACKGNPRE
ncbi:MAG: cysteine hydrolase family protein [Alphaproteobacteria bacterium]